MRTLFVIDHDQICQFIAGSLLKQTQIFDKIDYYREAKPVIAYLASQSHQPELLPDVIFLELHLPFFNGWDFLEALKAIYPALTKNIAVYVVTSYFGSADRERATRYPFIEKMIPKPLTREILLEVDKEINPG